MTGRAILTVRRRGDSRAWTGLALMAALAALWLAAASRVHVNASWSDDAWGYLVLPAGEPAIGDTVLFDPRPERGPGQASTPGARVPYLKTVRGLPGAVLTVDTRAGDADRTVRIDGVAVGRAKTHALDGRPLVAIAPGAIPDGHYFLHADHPDSHDSRYAEIGLVPRERILGRAVALPDLPWLGLEGPLVGPEDVRTGGPAGSGGGLEPTIPHPAETLVPETRQ